MTSLPWPRWLMRNGWTAGRAAAALGMVAVGVAATFDAWWDMGDIAVKDEEMSHVFLVPVVIAWLIWVRRGRWRQCRPTGLGLGPLVAALGWLAYWAGDYWLIESAWHGGAILVAVGCLLSVVGAEVLWRFLPAFLALFFMVPVPGALRLSIALPLQNAAAHLTEGILELLSQDVQRSGNLLTINGIDVTVADACNGMRMVFALTMVSYVFAFSSPLRQPVRLIIILLSPLLALVTNIIRLCVVVWVFGQVSQPKAVWFHDQSGWVMLPLGFLILLAVIRFLRWIAVPVNPYRLAYE